MTHVNWHKKFERQFKKKKKLYTLKYSIMNGMDIQNYALKFFIV